MQHVMSTVKQRHRALVCGLQDWSQSIPMMLQFCEVPPAEFIPTLRIVMEPFAQLQAWRDLAGSLTHWAHGLKGISGDPQQDRVHAAAPVYDGGRPFAALISGGAARKTAGSRSWNGCSST